MIGIDVSEHDVRRHPGLDWAAFFGQYEYVIARVSNENGYPDAYAAMLVAECRRSGKPWGMYAWPVVGWGLDQNRQHAANLIRQHGVPPIGMWADAEHSPRGFASHDEVLGFVLGCGDAGALGGYYCAIGELYRSGALDPVPWWMSDYDVNDGGYHDPNNQGPRPPPDRPWVIHQFTSLGWPGGGSLDVNYAPNLDFAGAPPAARLKDDDMYIVFDRDQGTHRLYTSLGSRIVDESYSNELAMAQVPRYSVPHGVADSTLLIHVAHEQEFLLKIPGDGEAPPPTDEQAIAQVNALLASGTASITGGQIV